jgi:hypothetical protein
MFNHLVIMQREYENKAAEKKKIRAETREMVQKCFRQAVLRVGDDEARKYWHEAAKRKGIKPKGSTNKERDEVLLLLYNEWVFLHPDEKSRAAAPRLVGEYFSKKWPPKENTPYCKRDHKAALPPHSAAKLKRSGTWNALAGLARTGKLPMGEPPRDVADK